MCAGREGLSAATQPLGLGTGNEPVPSFWGALELEEA
jgi:hypothetical protein